MAMFEYAMTVVMKTYFIHDFKITVWIHNCSIFFCLRPWFILTSQTNKHLNWADEITGNAVQKKTFIPPQQGNRGGDTAAVNLQGVNGLFWLIRL